ncbi:hypothetical protein EYF80_032710 [Liparis tanakae]|uniref:Uncharacterized protein n=1 Tax=Liparis tanakae TaxID=230148 RepID=A0A4Z2GVK6_9TELE|nr:hypothetical protein EYF80_032710 [Liparis tanakae]
MCEGRPCALSLEAGPQEDSVWRKGLRQTQFGGRASDCISEAGPKVDCSLEAEPKADCSLEAGPQADCSLEAGPQADCSSPCNHTLLHFPRVNASGPTTGHGVKPACFTGRVKHNLDKFCRVRQRYPGYL